jgi:hypothetical protein
MDTNRLDEIKQTPESQKSDLDLLISFSNHVTLLQFIRIKNYPSEITGVKTDIVMKNSLKPRMG